MAYRQQRLCNREGDQPDRHSPFALQDRQDRPLIHIRASVDAKNLLQGPQLLPNQLL